MGKQARNRKVALTVTKQFKPYPIYEDDYNAWAPKIKVLSERYQVPEALIHSIFAQESEYGNSVRAKNNVMQMSDDAVKEINRADVMKQYGWQPIPANFKTKDDGLEAGVRYLAYLRDHGGKKGTAIDLNDSFTIGKRYNSRDSYGKNMEIMVKEFSDYANPPKPKNLANELVQLPITNKPLNVNLLVGSNPYTQQSTQTLPGLNMPVYQGQ